MCNKNDVSYIIEVTPTLTQKVCFIFSMVRYESVLKLPEKMESPKSIKTHTDDDKILENEIESWHSFGSILRNENRIIFCQMLEDIKTYSETAKAKGKNFSFESMCMELILQQQKMIKELLLCKLLVKKGINLDYPHKT